MIDPKDILEFEGVKCQVNSSLVLVNKRLPVFQIKHLEEGEIQSMFGVLVNNEDEVSSLQNEVILLVSSRVRMLKNIQILCGADK